MKVSWIVLAILYYIITTSAHTRETPDFSCYFGNWTNGVCKFPWDGITDFNQCAVLLTIQDLKKDEENLRIFCDYEVSVCSIKIDFSLYDDLYGLYTTWANIRICFETEEYIDAKPFQFERKEVTKANPPEEIVVKTATPTNATLDWTNPDYCIDLDYHVRAEVSSNSREQFKDIYWSEYNCSESVRGSIFIPNLPYSDHNYLVKIRQKYVSAPDLEKFWSDEVVYGFRTKPSRPRVSPQTALGAFHTAHGGNVTIFWVGLEKKYWSASNFTYIVSYCHDYQFNTQSNSSRHVLWLNELDGQPNEYSVLKIPEGDIEICLRSGNSLGKSESFTKMKIFDTSLPPIRWVKKVLTNNTYEIIWSVSPAEKVTQFKLFVCKVDSVESESCRSSIVKVMKLSRKIFRYRYESEEILAFAVAPIYGDKSPGMTWARRRTKLPEILIRGVEPVNTTSVKILWSPLRDSLSGIRTNISLIYLNPNEPESSLTISKANSKMQQEGIYWTEIGGLSPESSVTIKYDDDLLPVRSCPNAIKFDLRHGVASVNVHFYPDRNSLWTTKLNGSVKEDKSQGSKLVLKNLQRHTTYLLEVESYTMDNGRRQCVLGQRKLFRTKSGKPGAVITKVINDGISLHLDCKVEENVNEDTIYEYSMRAVNDAVDEEDDTEGIPGPWSEVAFYNVNDYANEGSSLLLLLCS
uniref:Putative cytokine receptor rhopaloa n=1 Tax=Lutzomyia longipalpis TaxID=7200 RepID=A0A1B0CDM7_LUTLO